MVVGVVCCKVRHLVVELLGLGCRLCSQGRCGVCGRSRCSVRNCLVNLEVKGGMAVV